MKTFIQELKYVENYLPNNYRMMFISIAKYLGIDINKETDYENHDSWIKIYNFLKHKTKKKKELLDIFKHCEDDILLLIDWYVSYVDSSIEKELMLDQCKTDKEIIAVTKFALKEMYRKLTFDMKNIYYKDFERFVRVCLGETINFYD